jgi:hypothetical protein
MFSLLILFYSPQAFIETIKMKIVHVDWIRTKFQSKDLIPIGIILGVVHGQPYN